MNILHLDHKFHIAVHISVAKTNEDILDKNIESIEVHLGYLKRLVKHGYIKPTRGVIKDIKLAADRIDGCLTEMLSV
jgi:hypothetical protein